MKIYRKLAASAATLLALAALSGCSNGAETSGGGSGGGSDEAPKIGLLLPDSITARYDGMDRPIFEAKVAELCKECEVLYANADEDAAKQQQQAESMITQGVSVLVLDPFDSQAAGAIVAAASAQDIPVIAYDRLINHEDVTYYISFDNQKVGELQGQAIVDRLERDGVEPGDGGILMLNGSPTDNNALLFKAGAHKIIDPSGYEVLGEYDDWDPEKTQNYVAGQLTQLADQIRGVYAANDNNAGAALASMKAAGMEPLPPVTGQDAELAGIQRILSGEQFMTIYKALRQEAELAAELAVGLVNGDQPEGDTTVELEGGGTLQSFLLAPIVVTIDNIKDTIIKDEFYSVEDLCTAEFADACVQAGIE